MKFPLKFSFKNVYEISIECGSVDDQLVTHQLIK